MPASLGELEGIIGYRFKDSGLLERALTHRSWAYEKLSEEAGHLPRELQNETLEFIGDSVLGLVIAEQVFTENPELSEGELTVMKHHLVSADTLAEIAGELGMGRFVRLGKGEERSGGRERKTIQTDALEAVIGAVFVDGGYIQARSVVRSLYSGRSRNVSPESLVNAKALLQETLQAQKRKEPAYKVVKTQGPSHDRRFWVEASWDTGIASGSGKSIKAAETEAAEAALKMIRAEEAKKNAKGK